MSKEGSPAHVSVMINECLEHFSGCELSVFFEGTVGAGGHAVAILENHPEIKRYLACDQDPEAIALAKERLEPWKNKISFIQGNFASLDAMLEEKGIKQVNGFFLT